MVRSKKIPFKRMKKIIKMCICILLFGLLGFWGYWEYLSYKFEQDPLFYYKPRICMDLDPELADSVAEHFRAKAKYLRDSLGRIPTLDEMNNFYTNIDAPVGNLCKSSDK